MRVLDLTSPRMRGKDVREAQTLLKKYGAWSGKIDGVYGEVTARAVSQAKWRLGYRQKNIDYKYDSNLKNFLTGIKPQTPMMQQRSKHRSRKPVLRDAALAEAKKWIGTKENPPGSNKVFFSEWYGMRGPWCAMYVTWCYTQAKAKHFNKNAARWAYCPFMINDARNQRHGLTIVPKDKAKPGDIVLFDWSNDNVADHVGLLTTTVRGGIFKSIEGNTAVGADSDGGQVMIRERHIDDVAAFVRVWE